MIDPSEVLLDDLYHCHLTPVATVGTLSIKVSAPCYVTIGHAVATLGLHQPGTALSALLVAVSKVTIRIIR